ncbi:hypothetical protein EBU71_22675, partial [bacterium]|nr:hypothetical protein [Candidatus Elulimicrobium humile]
MAAGGENLLKYSTEFPRVQSVPIDSRQEDPYNAGEIRYMYREPSDPAGVYSLVFYWHGGGWPNFTKYLKGLHFYRRLVHDERFPGWKLVVYTDTETLNNLAYFDTDTPEIVNQKKMMNSVLNDPKLILAFVTWPEYAPFQTVENTNVSPWTGKAREYQKIFARNAPELSMKIHGPVFRCFRYHAFHYFPYIPVYVRDADTTFFWSDKLNAATLDEEFTKESQWEAAFFKYFTEFNRGNGNKYPMLLGTQVEYTRKWHKNARLPLTPGGKNFYGHNLPSYREGGMFGIYAGMMAYNGGIDEWKSPMLWHSSLDYIRGVCKILPNTGISVLNTQPLFNTLTEIIDSMPNQPVIHT